MYTQVGPQFRDELQRHHLPTSVVSIMKEIVFYPAIAFLYFRVPKRLKLPQSEFYLMFYSVSYLDDLYSLLQKLEPCSVNIITQLFFSKYGVKLQLKVINARLERIEPKVHSSDGLASSYTAVEIKPASLIHKRSSSKAKSSTCEVSLVGGLCVYL